jgi:hypothetical protein
VINNTLKFKGLNVRPHGASIGHMNPRANLVAPPLSIENLLLKTEQGNLKWKRVAKNRYYLNLGDIGVSCQVFKHRLVLEMVHFLFDDCYYHEELTALGKGPVADLVEAIEEGLTGGAGKAVRKQS